MNFYEMMILTSPQLEEQAQNSIIDLVKKYIEENQGKVLFVEKWGKRSLQYKIKHFTEAYYNIIYFNINSKFLSEMERRLRLKEEVLRYMIIRMIKSQIEKIKNKAESYHLIQSKEEQIIESEPNIKTSSEEIKEEEKNG